MSKIPELQSLSKYLDTKLTVKVVEGQVKSGDGHFVAAWTLTMKEVQNTPACDLWDFYIKPALDELAKKVNELGDVKVLQLALPPKDLGVGILSLDGAIPLRLIILRRAPDEIGPERQMYTIDLLVEPA